MQIVSYRVGSTSIKAIHEALAPISSHYRSHGCTRFEVYADREDRGVIYELAYFPDYESLESFERFDSDEKRALYATFCRTLEIAPASVKVKKLQNAEAILSEVKEDLGDGHS